MFCAEHDIAGLDDGIDRTAGASGKARIVSSTIYFFD